MSLKSPWRAEHEPVVFQKNRRPGLSNWARLKTSFLCCVCGHKGPQGVVLSRTTGLRQAPLAQSISRKRTAKPQAHSGHAHTHQSHTHKRSGRPRCGEGPVLLLRAADNTLGSELRGSHQLGGAVPSRPEFTPSPLPAIRCAAGACLGAGVQPPAQ